MIARVWRRPYVQQVLRELRKMGYSVHARAHGYEAFMDSELVFVALPWSKRDYVVRYAPELFEEPTESAQEGEVT